LKSEGYVTSIPEKLKTEIFFFFLDATRVTVTLPQANTLCSSTMLASIKVIFQPGFISRNEGRFT
jgi:hypothetical protein